MPLSPSPEIEDFSWSQHPEELPDSSLSYILSDLIVRTANLDNYRDREKILGIFNSHYENYHPIDLVMNLSFWENPQKYLMGETFTSLIIEDKNTGEGIAHIGLAFREQDRHAEILLPAIRSNWRHSLGTIFQKFYSKINIISQRRNWTHFVSVCITSDPFYQFIASNLFDCRATSMVPRSSHLNKKTIFEPKEILNHSDFVLVLYSPTRITRYYKNLYIPKSYESSIRDLIRDLGIATNLNRKTEDSYVNNNSSAEQQTILENGPYWKLKKHSLYNLLFLDLCPTNIIEKNKLLKLIDAASRHTKTNPIVRISLSNSLTPYFCEILNSLKLSFCGIDLIDEELVLILTKTNAVDINQIVLYGDKSKELKQLIYKMSTD